MDFLLSVDFTGYLASAILLISFLMKDIRTLRMINSVGCMLWVFYGYRLGWDVSIMVTNAAILSINLYSLFKRPSLKAE